MKKERSQGKYIGESSERHSNRVGLKVIRPTEKNSILTSLVKEKLT